MMTRTFFSFSLLLMCLLTVPAFAQRDRQTLQAMNNEILRMVNEHRAGIGRKPLENNMLIFKEADNHSRNMASGKTAFGHDGFDGRSGRLMKALPHSNASAENVAYGSRTAEAVVDMWLHSPGHKKNIEGDYNLTGIGIAESKQGVLYFTQIFIKTR